MEKEYLGIIVLNHQLIERFRELLHLEVLAGRDGGPIQHIVR
jgi:hypothetical protein